MSDLPNVQPAPNPWLGLGARPAKRNHPRTGSNASSSDEIEAFARPSVQRIVPAAGLPLPVSLPVSLPVITTTPPPTQAPIEEAPAMASNPPATTPTIAPDITPTPTGLQHSTTQGSGEPRQAMLLHLVHSPTGLTRKALVATLGWPWKKVTNTTYNALRAGLCEMDASGAYFITDAGKDWLAVKGTPVEGTPPASTSQPARKPGRVKVKTGDKAVWVDRTSAPGLAARRDKPAAKKVVDVVAHDAAQATAARGRAVQAAGLPLPVSLPVSLPVITTTPPPTQAPIEEAPAMASNPPATTPSTTPTPTGLQHITRKKSGEARYCILQHLVAAEPKGLSSTALAEKLGWPYKRTIDNLHHASIAGVLGCDAGSYRITPKGVEWLAKKGDDASAVCKGWTPPPVVDKPTRVREGGTTRWVYPPDHPAARRREGAKKVVNVPQHDAAQATEARGRAVQAAGMLARVMQVTGTLARPAVAQQASADSTVVVQIAPTFRAAVYTDGSFHLSKAGQSIELTATEHAQLLRFLERMAEAD